MWTADVIGEHGKRCAAKRIRLVKEWDMAAEISDGNWKIGDGKNRMDNQCKESNR